MIKYWFFLFIYIIHHQNLVMGEEEYKCCNSKSFPSFSCDIDFKDIKTDSKIFKGDLIASYVCLNYPNFKLKSGEIKTVIYNKEISYECKLCKNKSKLKQLSNSNLICSDCIEKANSFITLECPICLEELKENIELKSCWHSFHHSCLEKAGLNCPLCRQKNKNGSIKNLNIKDYEAIFEISPNLIDKTILLAEQKTKKSFILVDSSRSMKLSDTPPAKGISDWSRWESAMMTTIKISETRLTSENGIEVILWSGNENGQLHAIPRTCYNSDDIKKLFYQNQPHGNTPLTYTLKYIYQNHLEKRIVLKRPSDVTILTDGQPNHYREAIAFLERLNSRSSRVKNPLVSISFIKIGDDMKAEAFLKELSIKFDKSRIINFKDCKNQPLSRSHQNALGPFVLMWDPILD